MIDVIPLLPRPPTAEAHQLRQAVIGLLNQRPPLPMRFATRLYRVLLNPRTQPDHLLIIADALEGLRPLTPGRRFDNLTALINALRDAAPTYAEAP